MLRRPDEALCFYQNGSALYAGFLDSGVYVSSDNGGSWSNIGLKGIEIQSLAAIGNYLFAGTSDEIGDGAVYRTTNKGGSWAKPANNVSTAAFALATDGNYLYTGTATGTGLYVSTNNGTTWTNSNALQATVFSLAVVGSNLFAGTDNGMWLSTNHGKSWNAINTGLLGKSNWIYQFSLIGTTLFAATSGEGVCMTTNNGTSWSVTTSGLPKTNVSSITATGQNLFVGTDSGVYLSSISGQSWVSVNTELTIKKAQRVGVLGPNLYCSTVDIQTGNLVYYLWQRPLSEMIDQNSEVSTVHSESSVQAFPNPASNEISFSLNANTESDIRIVDLLGIERAHVQTKSEIARVSCSSLANGRYLTIIRENNSVCAVPISVQH